MIRYLDCLREDKKRGTWSDDEVELLKKLVAKHGVGESFRSEDK